jgi:putative transposase
MRGYSVKLYLNKKQTEQVDKEIGCSRFIYNKMIEINQKKYNRTGKGLSGYDMQSYLPKLKKQYPWLKEVTAQQLQITCHNLADAYNRFYKKLSNYPNFKKKSYQGSYKVVNGVSLEGNKLRLPKLGYIRYRGGDCPEGTVKSVTVKRSASGRYYASILIQTKEQDLPEQEFNSITGIDLGLKDFLITSTGHKVDNPKHLRHSEKKLKLRQKRHSNTLKGSKNRNKRRIILARAYEKIANQRKDFTHKVTKLLVADSDNQAFALEDLNIKGMVKNHKLAKSVSDASWGMFKTFLNYKAKHSGKQVFTVDRYYPSSKTCSACGIVNNNLQLSDREWTCNSCNAQHDRDLNAAINIRNEAWRNCASGGVVSPEVLVTKLKQTPTKLIKLL